MEILERLEGVGGDLLDTAGQVAGARLKQEIAPSNPKNASDQPERQYETQLETPVSGPEAAQQAQPSPGKVISDTMADYKWVAAGALALVAFAAYKGAQ